MIKRKRRAPTQEQIQAKRLECRRKLGVSGENKTSYTKEDPGDMSPEALENYRRNLIRLMRKTFGPNGGTFRIQIVRI
jgi:hypothetical protein